MTSRLAAGLAAIGLLLAVVGGILGFATINRDGTSCGSAFKPTDRYELIGTDLDNSLSSIRLGQAPDTVSVANDCASATGDRKTIALVALVPGGLMLLAGIGIHWESVNRRAEARLARGETAEDVQPPALS